MMPLEIVGTSKAGRMGEGIFTFSGQVTEVLSHF